MHGLQSVEKHTTPQQLVLVLAEHREIKTINEINDTYLIFAPKKECPCQYSLTNGDFRMLALYF